YLHRGGAQFAPQPQPAPSDNRCPSLPEKRRSVVFSWWSQAAEGPALEQPAPLLMQQNDSSSAWQRCPLNSSLPQPMERIIRRSHLRPIVTKVPKRKAGNLAL